VPARMRPTASRVRRASAMLTLRSTARRSQWPIRSCSAGACGPRDLAVTDHRRQCHGGIEHGDQPYLRHRGRRRLPFLPFTLAGFALAGGAPTSASMVWAPADPTCSRPALCASHRRPAMSPPRSPMAGRTSPRSHRHHQRRRPAARRVQRQCLSAVPKALPPGWRHGRRHRLHALRRRQFVTFDLRLTPNRSCRGRIRCADLRLEERDRHASELGVRTISPSQCRMRS